MIDNAVQMGSKIGSSVLGSIADALEQAGTRWTETARHLRRLETPPGTQVEKRRPVRRRCADGGWLDLCRLLWHRGVRAGHPDGSRRRAAGAFPRQDFIALPILTAVFYPTTLGFLFMAIVGMKQMAYFSRLRKLLRAANDWVCDLPPGP